MKPTDWVFPRVTTFAWAPSGLTAARKLRKRRSTFVPVSFMASFMRYLPSHMRASTLTLSFTRRPTSDFASLRPRVNSNVDMAAQEEPQRFSHVPRGLCEVPIHRPNGAIVKTLVLLTWSLFASAPSLANDLVLLRIDQGEASYYEASTIRRTGQLVMAWIVTVKNGQKHSEYLSEFDCEKAKYRQLSLRSFASSSQVVSTNAVYKEWLDVPNTTQILGLLFAKVCAASSR